MSLRSQIATEFLLLVMFIFVIFTAFVIGANHYRIDLVQKEKDFLSRDMASLIHGEIFIAYNSYEGYTRAFDLPSNLVGAHIYEYQTYIKDNILVVLTDESEITYPVPIENATLNIGDLNVITKTNEGVFLN